MKPDFDLWQKMLVHPQPSIFLKHYFSENSLASLPRYLHLIDSIPAGPLKWHAGTILDHLCYCADAVAGDPIAVWMAIVHDFGKLTTPTELLPHHYGHEERGQILAKDFGEKIAVSSQYLHAGILCAKLHMKAGRYYELRFSTKRDLLMEIENAGFTSSFWKFVDADTKDCISNDASADLACILSIRHNNETLEQWRQEQIVTLQTWHNLSK